MLTCVAPSLLGHGHGHDHPHATILLVTDIIIATDPKVLAKKRRRTSEESVIGAIPANMRTTTKKHQIARNRNRHAHEIRPLSHPNDRHIEVTGNETTTRRKSGNRAEVIGPIDPTVREIEAKTEKKPVVEEAVANDLVAAL